ncbi:aminotransferase class I/II-fold pyridoxal phosphate-dependent enzyme [Limisalsivibrio acetivorans]|uniref:aminotransferase class I/II-fold pyridoxal phosphate-dependent enzyme n=1 Tax=Limisalsivibrio acetivorans TaxID=1304888 RepID=UPI0003B352FD|nr:aminotransferase class I/II-fold pyridoxal phosphate-dependent enzyme [Limisalsivibrio acetivorans]
MNALAKELNELIAKDNPAVLEMLSELGKNLFMPKGIVTQSAEAKEKAHKFNATIGIALENGQPMYLQCVYDNLSKYAPKDIFPYAPSSGKPELRKRWKQKIFDENPTLSGKATSNPVVTNALTHGLNVVGDMFLDKGDYVVLPDKFWGNYRLGFSVIGGAEIATYETFTEEGGFNVQALLDKVEECGRIKGKAVAILNFPNNPSGYTPTVAEATAIADGLTAIAEKGIKVIAVTDDAYFTLFYEDTIKESIFGLLTGRSKNLLPVKLDGATKEEFVWGFRVGFITFGATESSEQKDMMAALEKKVTGLIRGTISNCPHPSQTFVLNSLDDECFKEQKQQKFELMKERALKFKEVLNTGKYLEQFEYYPFNSGYFMCLKLKNVDAEELRVHLLDNYGIGTISVNKTDLRIAFSCVEASDTEELLDGIFAGCKDLAK